jgi:hypothetical protein
MSFFMGLQYPHRGDDCQFRPAPSIAGPRTRPIPNERKYTKSNAKAQVIVELKCVIPLAPVFKAQLLSYLRASGIKLGLLINFNEVVLRKGIIRIVNNL